MSLKISQMTAGGTASATDLIPVDREGTNVSLTALAIANLAPGSSSYNIVYSTDYEWTLPYAAGWGTLTAGVQATLTLAVCPQGIDTTGSAVLGYSIYITDAVTPANSESVKITGGTGSSGISGTIIFTPKNNHTNYSLGSATAGIQEAINVGGGINTTAYKNGRTRVVIPPVGLETGTMAGYNIYDTIYMHTNNSILSGYGAILNHWGRGPCIQVGDLVSSNDYCYNTVEGISFRSPTATSSMPAYYGVRIASTQRISHVVTITTATPHGFVTGDRVTQILTDDPSYWGDVPAITVTGTTTYTYPVTAGDIALQTTPGCVALTYICILDNAQATDIKDINQAATYQYSGGSYGGFNNILDFWDDENATVDNLNAGLVNQNANWAGSVIFSGGAGQYSGAQAAAVITVKNSSITNACCGVTVFNSNGLYVENCVIQNPTLWQIFSSNICGNYMGANIRNLYGGVLAEANASSPVHSPFAGLGNTGAIFGPSSGTAEFTATQAMLGDASSIPTFGTTGTRYLYYVVIHDTTTSTVSAPLPAMYALSAGGVVTVSWPRVANGTDTITYDVLRTTVTSVDDIENIGPYSGGCPGGSTSALGSVVVGQAQQTGFIQTFADNTTVNTTAYPTVSVGTYAGNFAFWPSISVVSQGGSPLVSDTMVPVFAMGSLGNPSNICQYSEYGTLASPAISDCASSLFAVDIVTHPALILNDGGLAGLGQPTNTKGRLNFAHSNVTGGYVNAGHIITLVDSDPQKTRAYALNRPLASTGDVYIGTDTTAVTNVAGLSLGSPISITNYIANLGDGTNWGERLTSSLKQFKVPVQCTNLKVTGTLTDGANSVGGAGQVLSSTITGTAWIDLAIGTTAITLTNAPQTTPPVFSLKGSRGTVGTPTTSSQGDTVGSLDFYDYITAVGYGKIAQIKGVVGEGGTGTGHLGFWVADASTGVLFEGMALDGYGHLTLTADSVMPGNGLHVKTTYVTLENPSNNAYAYLGNDGTYFWLGSTDGATGKKMSVKLNAPDNALVVNELTLALALTLVPQYANNAAAVAGGLTAGTLYRTGADPDAVCIVH